MTVLCISVVLLEQSILNNLCLANLAQGYTMGKSIPLPFSKYRIKKSRNCLDEIKDKNQARSSLEWAKGDS
jgi:hypothetical protein